MPTCIASDHLEVSWCHPTSKMHPTRWVDSPSSRLRIHFRLLPCGEQNCVSKESGVGWEVHSQQGHSNTISNGAKYSLLSFPISTVLKEMFKAKKITIFIRWWWIRHKHDCFRMYLYQYHQGRPAWIPFPSQFYHLLQRRRKNCFYRVVLKRE